MANFLNQIKNSLSRSLPQRIKSGEFFVFLHQYNVKIDYQLKVSAKRKSLSLELSRGQVVVRAPYWLEMQDIEGFILSKQDWLMDKLQQQATMPQPFNYQDGERLLLQGQWLTLKLKYASQFNQCLDLNTATLTLTIPHRVKNHSVYVRNKLKFWYQQLAADFIPKRVEQLQAITKLNPTSVELKMFKSRWGCCYRSGKVIINPMLMGAPDWVIDCVIIHELCHLTHMNHSKAFWQLNKVHCACCSDTKAWLKQHGLSLYLN